MSLDSLGLFAAVDFTRVLDGAAGPVFAAALSAAAGFGLGYLKRKRPAKIVCEVLSASPTITFSHDMGSKVQVTYNGHPARSLAILEIAVYNDGATTVNDVDLTIALPSTTRIIEVEFPNPRAADTVAKVLRFNDSTLQIQAPYMNTLCGHNDKLLLKLMCDGDINDVSVQGRGKGWSVRRRAQADNVDSVLSKLASAIMVLLGGMLFTIANAVTLNSPLLPGFNLSTLATIGMLFVVIAVGVFPEFMRQRRLRLLRG